MQVSSGSGFLLAVLVAAAVSAVPASAQTNRSAGPVFAEFAGSTLGSALGALGGASLAEISDGECIPEQVICELERLAVGIVLGSTVGAIVGGQIGARLAGDAPSLPGQILGSLAGVAAAVGVVYLMSDVSAEGAVIAFPVTHGAITTGASWLMGRFQGRGR